MRPVRVRDENAIFTEPVDWNEAKDGKCIGLPIRREKIGERTYHYSNWKPDADEIARLSAGESVELCCVGLQPPVSLRVIPGELLSAPILTERDLEAEKLKKAS